MLHHCIVPPNISAINSNYTAVVGSQVMMEHVAHPYSTHFTYVQYSYSRSSNDMFHVFMYKMLRLLLCMCVKLCRCCLWKGGLVTAN